MPPTSRPERIAAGLRARSTPPSRRVLASLGDSVRATGLSLGEVRCNIDDEWPGLTIRITLPPLYDARLSVRSGARPRRRPVDRGTSPTSM